jgi:hypothetical protein
MIRSAGINSSVRRLAGDDGDAYDRCAVMLVLVVGVAGAFALMLVVLVLAAHEVDVTRRR